MNKTLMLCTSVGVLLAASPDAFESYLANKTHPLDIKIPVNILSKRQNQELLRYNLGMDTGLSAGYDENYAQETSFKSQLTSFDFKFLYLVNPWIALNGKLSFDTAPLPASLSSPPNFLNRLSNSRAVLNEGYAVLGDLNKTPWYAYWGQLSLPYGKNFAPSSATDLSSRMHQITQRPLGIGWAKEVNHIYLNPEFFFFNGDSKPIRSAKNQTFGFTMNGSKTWQDSTLKIQAGWVSNVADSNGFQRTVSSIPGASNNAEFDYADDSSILFNTQSTNLTTLFAESGGFASSHAFEKIQYRVPASSFAVEWSLPSGVTVSSAYATALKSFDYRDLAYRSSGIPFSNQAPPTDAEGARPSAWNVYVKKDLNDGFALHTGIEGTDQALAINLPRKRWTLGGSKKLDAFTKVEFELKSDTNYSTHTDALGPARSDVSNAAAIHVDGQTANPVYALTPSGLTSEGHDFRGKKAVDFVVALKIKF